MQIVAVKANLTGVRTSGVKEGFEKAQSTIGLESQKVEGETEK